MPLFSYTHFKCHFFTVQKFISLPAGRMLSPCREKYFHLQPETLLPAGIKISEAIEKDMNSIPKFINTNWLNLQVLSCWLPAVFRPLIFIAIHEAFVVIHVQSLHWIMTTYYIHKKQRNKTIAFFCIQSSDKVKHTSH